MGIFGSVGLNVVTNVGLGMMTGGTSLLAQTALRLVVSNIGQQVIQQMGQQMGLPQGAIDLAQAGFAGSMGDVEGANRNYQEVISEFGASVGASPFEVGEANQSADALGDLLLQASLRARDDVDTAALRAGGKGGGSLLMKIAIALGKVMDQKMSEMDRLTTQIGGLGTVGPKNQSKLGELTGKLQGLGQEVNLLSNAMTNSIKSIGEASTTIARKG